MIEVPDRKYRGALRIAPLRQVAAEALAAGDLDEAREALFALRAAGFAHVADQIESTVDERSGTRRCPACRTVLTSRWTRLGWDPMSKRNCSTCVEHWEKVRIASFTRKQRLRNEKLGRRAIPGRGDPSRWPWILIGRGPNARYRLQRSWRHLRHELPEEPPRGAEENERANKIIRAELARRKAAS